MTNGHRKSDKSKVAAKFPNKTDAKPGAEEMEPRDLPKGNPAKQNIDRIQSRKNVQNAFERVRQAAQKDRRLRFNSLFHQVYSLDTLRCSFMSLKKDAAPGVDGQTWRHYEENLEEYIQDLSKRLAQGGYRAKPVRRVYIPKEDGRQRPLGVTTLEDKIVQRALVEVLNAIYETDFLGFSYGYRPGKRQHDCLDALYVGQLTRKINYVLDCDIRGFFDTISHEWMIKFIEHRIADKRIIRLIKKWLNAGVLEDGLLKSTKEGTPQGGSVSPFLANVYLHYVFDLWAQHWRKTKAKGDMIMVRWADDIVVGFQSKHDAEIFKKELAERFAKFSLEMHPEKTKVIEFGPYAIANAKKRGKGKPETFDFLGFTHICGVKRSNGMFTVIRKTKSKKMRAKLKQVKIELRRRMHEPVPEIGKWLKSIVEGHCRYYGVPMNLSSLKAFRFQVIRYWHWTLNRRSQKPSVNWDRMKRYIDQWLPPVKIHHPYPLRRFGVIT
jgi:group II intron reverse transcriptase/maturase